MNKNLFKLARMLKLLSEVSTDKGMLVSEGEIEVGTEVFVYNEEGEAVPAADGEYIVDGGELTIVVVDGIVSEMRAKEEAPVEQPVEPETVVVEEAEEETPAEEAAEEAAEETETVDIEALKAEIEALKAENEELKAKIAEYEQKEKEAEEPSVEEEDKQEFTVQNGLDEKQKRAASILKYRQEK